MNEQRTLTETITKLERFCAYQERCHKEVTEKLWSLSIAPDQRDAVIVHLLDNNYLNEERFARSFARGKHRIKSWGKNRIVNELKMRGITKFNITAALSEITEDEYLETFKKLSEKQWELVTEKNALKKRKKVCDFLLRKGFESDLVYQKVIELENNS